MKKAISFFLALLLAIPTYANASSFESNYEIGYTTQYAGSKPIWVRRAFTDVSADFWFYPALQRFRKLGVVTGNQYGEVFLQEETTVSQVYALFVRYIYSQEFNGEAVDGAIWGDYTYVGKYAWLDAYDVVASKLANTIAAIGHRISLPAGEDATITRKQAFVLYCMAALSRCEDPVWYFGQFSSKQLGYFARSNAPIRRYEDNKVVTGFFSAADHYSMTPLQIQSANMLMYLGVLEGDQYHTLAPEKAIDRASAVKLLVGIDNVDGSPHVDDSGDSSDDDWGGSSGEYPEPSPISTPTPTPTATAEPTPPPTPTPTAEPTPEPTPTPLPMEPASCIFVDWDGAIMASMICTTNVDLTEQLDTYVKAHFVHPDLRETAFSSSLREDNYRGKYTGYADGDSYPLTAKLDYNFAGWVECGLDDFKIKNTTVGTAGLDTVPALFDPSEGVKAGVTYLKACYVPGPMLIDANYTLAQKPLIIYTDRCDTDVEELIPVALYDEDIGSGIPYGSAMTTVMTVFLYFERANYNKDGVVCGVRRALDPVLDILCTTDDWYTILESDMEYCVHPIPELHEDGIYESTFHARDVPKTSKDTLSFALQVVPVVWTAPSYVLRDEYQSNFIEGETRSVTNEWYALHEMEEFYIPHASTYAHDVLVDESYYHSDTYTGGRGTYGWVVNAALDGLSYNCMAEWTRDTFDSVFGNFTVNGCQMDYFSDLIGIDKTSSSQSGGLIAGQYAIKYILENHYQEHGWWHEQLDMPKLTVHQVLYLYNQQTSRDWVLGKRPESLAVPSPAEAEAMTLPGCKLHTRCVEAAK